ncbi:YlbE-like family protein [Bacillus pinisoli]|uniref:YlbE-like family protein n=1 Tax=Bacillus pinisoli TaxID=2901866 RepID=UPI001FF2EE89|nr:YlbE-like family protein [Bacillus pinisoli]
MRQEVLQIIRSNDQYKKYVREQPFWYRKLSRNPSSIQELDLASKEYYKQTIPHKVTNFSQQLQMASMMIGMFQSMRESD